MKKLFSAILTLFLLSNSTWADEISHICFSRPQSQSIHRPPVRHSRIKENLKPPDNISPFKNALYLQKSLKDEPFIGEICEKRKKSNLQKISPLKNENLLWNVQLEKLPKA